METKCKKRVHWEVALVCSSSLPINGNRRFLIKWYDCHVLDLIHSARSAHTLSLPLGCRWKKEEDENRAHSKKAQDLVLLN
uniref:Uncharacterized protein n=1 Tax=Arundo donax TaxID=35708 RepID=A0A0A9AGT6_ARUDO